jgi:hypothetical protein
MPNFGFRGRASKNCGLGCVEFANCSEDRNAAGRRNPSHPLLPCQGAHGANERCDFRWAGNRLGIVSAVYLSRRSCYPRRPADRPACMRHRPFATAGDWHGLALLVRASHRGLRCTGNLPGMGLILKSGVPPGPRRPLSPSRHRTQIIRTRQENICTR